jgi:hypothetical protein
MPYRLSLEIGPRHLRLQLGGSSVVQFQHLQLSKNIFGRNHSESGGTSRPGLPDGLFSNQKSQFG